MSSTSSPKTSRASGSGLLVGIVLAIIFVAASSWFLIRRGADADEFARHMNSGKTLFEKGDPGRAVEAFQKALALNPNNPDVHLNLANAHLLANQAQPAISHAAEVLNYEPGSAAAHYLMGCAYLRLNQFTNAVQSLTQAKAIDRTVNSVSYQLGRAYAGLGRFEEAAAQFDEVTQFETNHPSAFYQLSQMLIRLNRRAEATEKLTVHQALAQGRPQVADNPSLYEKSQYTQIRAPLALEQPDASGVRVVFADATAAVLGSEASRFRAPFALFDNNRKSFWDILAAEGETGFRFLINSNGVFSPAAFPINVSPAGIKKILVGDLQNDRFEDALLLGENGVQVLRLGTNAAAFLATAPSGLRAVSAIEGGLADLDFSGKLGLILVSPQNKIRTFRNLATGNILYRETTSTSGIPAEVSGVIQVQVDDWSNDDIPDVLFVRKNDPPELYLNQRGGEGFKPAPKNSEWPVASAAVFGDLNNDLRTDVLFLTPDSISIFYSGLKEPRRIPAKRHQLSQLKLVDYDNDGWLDVVGWGVEGIRVWRNRGRHGFSETTEGLGLRALNLGPVEDLAAADLDNDCDTDWLVSLPGKGLRFLRNDGGNQNGQVKIRLLGNRSNSSGLGTRVELSGGLYHALRSVYQLPTEIGVGKRDKLDSITVRWTETQTVNTDATVECKVTSTFPELTIPQGSCPYLYAWDGKRFRFVTDLLGASPVGLPVAEGRYIEADPDEFVWVGNSTNFLPRDGRYALQITEELREILYLDEAKLIVVDHPPGTEVHPTSKLLPGKPFLPHELVLLENRRPLRSATRLDQTPVTELLREIDGKKVSPLKIKPPQLRGIAETDGMVLDFGPLPTDRPLVLALTGWLRFGGGMANIAASHNPEIPFPFPSLEVETSDGVWRPVDVRVGAPAGKTKTILVDLQGKLPAQARRLRLTQAFEIHWDRAALFERSSAPLNRAQRLAPARTDLHWRGYSRFADLPWTEPLTPVYEDVFQRPFWRITPSGWATRYGSVDALIGARDNGVAIIAGGDELTLEFDAAAIPPVEPGLTREFFLWSVGWDKDEDFHVALGWQIDPLPWHGMNDQTYGKEPRPRFETDSLHASFNTRWVAPMTFDRIPAPRAYSRANLPSGGAGQTP